MTQTIKYPAWWPENARGNEDPTGANMCLGRNEMRAMDNEHIVKFLTSEFAGREVNPVIDWELFNPMASIGHNMNAALAIGMQSIYISFHPIGVSVGEPEEDAEKEFDWATVLETAFNDITLFHFDDDRIEQAYDALLCAAKRIRVYMDGNSE